MERFTPTNEKAACGFAARSAVRSAHRTARPRPGLSTLEMVLSLPILLFVMALMINFGTVAGWKVRQLSVARHALWASRRPRSTGTVPRPQYWPQSASMAAGGAGELAVLDDPRIDHPVVRGPLPYGTLVDEDLLDPARGLRRGSSDLHRGFPLLARMGAYHLHTDELLLDDKWQHRQMGLWSTRDRRIPVIYELAQASAAVVDAYVRAAVAIVYSPLRAALRPLDRDEEFIYYSRRFTLSPTFPYHGAPDFHPRLNLPCSYHCRAGCREDHELVRQRVAELIDRIQGRPAKPPERRVPSLAERMAGSFISLYESVIRELESSPGNHQAEIAQLQDKIETLRQFRTSLQGREG